MLCQFICNVWERIFRLLLLREDTLATKIWHQSYARNLIKFFVSGTMQVKKSTKKKAFPNPSKSLDFNKHRKAEVMLLPGLSHTSPPGSAEFILVMLIKNSQTCPGSCLTNNSRLSSKPATLGISPRPAVHRFDGKRIVC